MKLSKVVNKPCYCGSGKKYKKCHMNQDIEVDKIMAFADPVTKQVRCFIGGETFAEGDKIDLIYYNKIGKDVPVCSTHKEEYLKEKRAVRRGWKTDARPIQTI